MTDLRPAGAVLIVLTLLLWFAGVGLVTSEPPSGSFVFVVDGYLITGTLSQGVIGHGGRVRMLMSIDQTISSQYGPVNIVGSGTWVGETDFHSFNGVITDVVGTIQACVIFYCQTGDFAGTGTWSGSMSWNNTVGTQGSGVFRGALTLTGQQITSSGQVAIAGNWTDTFQS